MLKIREDPSSMSSVAVDLYFGVARNENIPTKKMRDPAKVISTHFLLRITLQYSIKSTSFFFSLLSILFHLIIYFLIINHIITILSGISHSILPSLNSSLLTPHSLLFTVYSSLSKLIRHKSSDEHSIPGFPVIIRISLPVINHQANTCISYNSNNKPGSMNMIYIFS